VNTENRPVREDYETYIEYKRALEHYIYWLGQEEVSMRMKLKNAIARHMENKNLVKISSNFSNKSKIQERISQLANPLNSIDDKWVPFVPPVFVKSWDSMPVETKCIVQGFCLRIADLQSEIDDQCSVQLYRQR